MMNIIRVNTNEDFLKLKQPWTALFEESSQDNVFLTWEWMYTWWKSFKQKQDELMILLGLENSRICAIAPFFIRKRFNKKIRFLGSGIACSEYLSLIVSKKNEKEFMSKIFDFLHFNSEKWDVLCLEGLYCNNGTHDYWKTFAREKGWNLTGIKEHFCFYLPLILPVEKLSGTINRSLSKNARYYKRKLSREGKLECKEVEISSNKELLAHFETVVKLHQKRWQSTGTKISGVFSNTLLLDFVRTVTKEFNKNKWVSIVSLFLNGKVIASCYNFKFNKKIYGYTKGFEPKYRNYSPGLVCLWGSIEIYARNGYKEFDFLRGGENYKEKWTDKFRKQHDLIIVKNTLKGNLFIQSVKFYSSAKKIIKRIVSPGFFAYLQAIKFKAQK